MLTLLLSISDENDHEKIVYLYRIYHDYMIKIATSLMTNRSAGVFEPEDAVQNAFIVLINHIDQLEFEDERRLRSYVATITQNETRMLLRKENKHVVHRMDLLNVDQDNETFVETIPSAEDFAEQIAIHSQYEQVVNTLKQLDDRYRLPLHLFYVEELSVNQIAKILHMPTNSVYTALRRGITLLREKINRK